ncbi:permease [Campylobacter sp. VTCC 70190]|uniref:permease n=1 Tax=Campylobacter sp. VTCC 70190 TaxID=3392118 RepID=UPI00398EFA50
MHEKILLILKDFAFLFTELSVLFILVNMLVAYLNEKYSAFFEKHLKKASFSSCIKAIFLGALTPFCSCSSLPLLNAFLKAKVPLSVCLSYLITSPLINPILIVAFIVSFGLKISFAYFSFLFFSILFIAFCVSKMNKALFFKKEYLSQDQQKSCCQANSCENKVFTQNKSYINPRKNPLKKLFYQSFNEYKKIFFYILLAVALGALMHGFVPKDFFDFLKDYEFLGVVLAALIGVLLYTSCSAMIPITLALVQSGVPLGIVMSFLIAGAGCSLPELIMLKSIFKFSFLFYFALLIVCIAIGFGSLVFYL